MNWKYSENDIRKEKKTKKNQKETENKEPEW